MELSKRLSEIAAFVPRGSIVADIGTDHALLPINLVETAISPKVIASDINKGPFEAARKAVFARGLDDKIVLRLGDGLTILSPGEVDTVVIAGMGGNTMREVLITSPEVVGSLKKIILQPMADAYYLRSWLVQNGWFLSDEKLVKDGEHLYIIIIAEPGRGKVYDELLLEIGPCLVDKKDRYLPLYLEKKIQDLDLILDGLSKSPKEHNLKKANIIKKKISGIREVLYQCR